MKRNNFGKVVIFIALMNYNSLAIGGSIINKWLNIARSVESVMRPNNITKDESNLVKIPNDKEVTVSTSTLKPDNDLTNTSSSPFVYNIEENIEIVRDTMRKVKEQLGLEDTNSDHNEILGMLMDELNSTVAADMTGSIMSDAATETLVDGIADSIAPILANIIPILSSLVKPNLSQLSSQMLNDIANITMELFSSGKISKVINEPEYEAYPIFIPNYGSYIMLTNSGAFDPVKLIKKTVNKLEGNSASHLKNSTNVVNNTVTTAKSMLKNILQAITTNATEDYELLGVTEDQLEGSRDKEQEENHIESKRKLNSDMQTFFLGQIHLIPLYSHPNVFSKTKSLWNLTEEEAVKKGIQKVIAAKTSVKEIRKRLILYWLRQLEYVIVKT